MSGNIENNFQSQKTKHGAVPEAIRVGVALVALVGEGTLLLPLGARVVKGAFVVPG